MSSPEVTHILVNDYCIVGTETARDVIAEWMQDLTGENYHAADSLMAALDKSDVRFIAVPELTSLVASEVEIERLRSTVAAIGMAIELEPLSRLRVAVTKALRAS